MGRIAIRRHRGISALHAEVHRLLILRDARRAGIAGIAGAGELLISEILKLVGK
ncbi:hypothetical protein D3C71_2197140 [compost metagenome]